MVSLDQMNELPQVASIIRQNTNIDFVEVSQENFAEMKKLFKNTEEDIPISK